MIDLAVPFIIFWPLKRHPQIFRDILRLFQFRLGAFLHISVSRCGFPGSASHDDRFGIFLFASKFTSVNDDKEDTWANTYAALSLKHAYAYRKAQRFMKILVSMTRHLIESPIVGFSQAGISAETPFRERFSRDTRYARKVWNLIVQQRSLNDVKRKFRFSLRKSLPTSDALRIATLPWHVRFVRKGLAFPLIEPLLNFRGSC